MGSNKLNWTEL